MSEKTPTPTSSSSGDDSRLVWIIENASQARIRDLALELLQERRTPSSIALGYCSDCESNVETHDGRCGCGSGRVVEDSPVSSLRNAAKRVNDLLNMGLQARDLSWRQSLEAANNELTAALSTTATEGE
jgi:hypothetical protein